MVRFSDMLGGDGDPKEPRATTVPASEIADPIPEPEPEPEPEAIVESAVESPQAVLDRLTQYATSTRAAEVPPEPAPTPTPNDAPTAETGPTEIDRVGDDLLPRGKGATRKPSRRNKRRP